MKSNPLKKAILLLEDGKIFKGYSAGVDGTAYGEICFNTGMTGYQEVFTDPSYFGQILVATHVHIGNYGIQLDESESDGIKIAALVCRDFSVSYSRHSADTDIETYFLHNDRMVIRDIDTRAVVRYIRDKGAMNALISTDIDNIEALKKKLAGVPTMEGLELSSKVSTKEPYFFGDPAAERKVAVLDLGVKKNILRLLGDRNCYVKVFPYDTSFEEMQAWEPAGYLISNGPGDPGVMQGVVNTVKKIIDSDIPIFGICLGHQVLAEACGIKTYKMFNGHRGINHPVQNLETLRCEITSQNHGFAIVEEDVKNSDIVEATHINLNDNTVEGIKVKDKKAFSVQYHPESAPGPNDSRYLFDQFISIIEIGRGVSA